MKLFLSLLSAALIITACKKKQEEPEILPASLNDSVRLQLFEQRLNPGHNFIIEAVTFKRYPCSNYLIETKKEINGSQLVIHFVKAELTSAICLPAAWGASDYLEYPNIANGNYDVTFYIGNTKILAQLIITSQKYELVLPKQPWIYCSDPVLIR